MNPSALLDFELFRLSGTPVTVATLLTAVAVLFASRWVSWLLQRALTRALANRPLNAGTTAVARRLLHYAVVLVGFAVAMETLGINLSALFAAGAVFAVGLGFAMQNIAQNFVSGVILLLERSIKPGDVLEIQDTVVRVQEMGIRSTLVRSRDDEDLIVPNSVMVQGTVKNYTLRDSLYRVRTSVGVTYASDLRLVAAALRGVAEAQSWRSQERDPRVLLTQFGSSSVDFEISVWMDDPWEARIAVSNLNEGVWWALKDAGVTIAFPQLDVHFDPPVTESLQLVAGRAGG